MNAYTICGVRTKPACSTRACPYTWLRPDAPISDLSLDAIAGLTDGHAGKLLTGTKGIGATTFTPLLDALGITGVLYADDDKRVDVERRDTTRVRDKGRIGRDAIKRARPVVMRELAQLGGRARWNGATPECGRHTSHA
jgi:hypothetical protein